jgi:hypothetical protein
MPVEPRGREHPVVVVVAVGPEGRVAWGGIFSLLPSAAVVVAVDDVCRANEKSRGRERLPISVAVDNAHRQVTRTPSD